MLYLLDTNAVRDITDRNANMLARMANLPPWDLAVMCSIVKGEVLNGIERTARGRRRHELEVKTELLLRTIPCVSVPCEAAGYYGTIKAYLEDGGRKLEDNDLWIAATALALNAVLITRDRGFRRIRELTIEDWTT